MTDRLAVLYDTLAALEQAAHRLHATHEGLADLFPLTPEGFQILDEPRRERLDAYAIRYARCQDLLFPAMRALGRAQLEPKAERSFLDLFALMQKQGVVGDINDWERQRNLRNAVGHEYPNPAEIVDILNAIREAVPEILRYLAVLQQRAAVNVGAPKLMSNPGPRFRWSLKAESTTTDEISSTFINISFFASSRLRVSPSLRKFRPHNIVFDIMRSVARRVFQPRFRGWACAQSVRY